MPTKMTPTFPPITSTVDLFDLVDNDPIKQIDWDHQNPVGQTEETPKHDLSTKYLPDLSDIDSVAPNIGDASLGKRSMLQGSNIAEISPHSDISNTNFLTLSNPQKMIKLEPRSPNMSMSSPVHYDKNGNYDDKYQQDQDQLSSKSGFDDILDNIDNRSQEGFNALEDFITKNKEDDQQFTLNDF